VLTAGEAAFISRMSGMKVNVNIVLAVTVQTYRLRPRKLKELLKYGRGLNKQKRREIKMLKEKINNTAVALNSLAGRVSEDVWLYIRGVYSELADAAEMAGAYESKLMIPRGGVIREDYNMVPQELIVSEAVNPKPVKTVGQLKKVLSNLPDCLPVKSDEFGYPLIPYVYNLELGACGRMIEINEAFLGFEEDTPCQEN
jgi:hypothetical protein